MPAATETFKLDVSPSIGIFKRWSHCSMTSVDTPNPSSPNTRQKGTSSLIVSISSALFSESAIHVTPLCFKYARLADIFDDGIGNKDGLFIANIGHLQKPVNRHNFDAETDAQLFSHFSMREEGFK